MGGLRSDLAYLRHTQSCASLGETLLRAKPDRIAQSLVEPLLMPTRRDVLKMGLAASALTSSLGRAVCGFAAGVPITVACRRNRAAFSVDGAEVFAVDAARFSGAARVTLVRLPSGSQRIKLKGARWPGTRLSADMTLTLDDVGKLDIKLALGGFSARVVAKEWLLGEKVASSRVSLPGLVCKLDSRGVVGLRGSALAEFSPDWRLALFGRRIGIISVNDETVRSGKVAISIPATGEPSPFARPLARRTQVVFERGDESWLLTPLTLTPDAGHLEWTPDAVDTLTLELAESASGSAYRAVVADAPANGAARFSPADRTGLAGAVSLSGTRTVASFDGAGERVAVLASIAAGSRLKTGGLTLHLADHPEARAFEATGGPGAHTVTASPRVAAIVAGLDGVITSPIRLPNDASAQVALGTTRTPSVVIGPTGGVRLPDGSQIEVIRPLDMLNISVSFWGMKLVSSPMTEKALMRAADADVSYLGYGFPPQAFNEQAIWDTSDPADPNAVLPSIATPVKAQISGWSQLSFQLTPSLYETGIPYTIEALLDWSALRPVINMWGQAEIPFFPGAALRPTDPRISAQNGRPTTYLEMPYHLYISPNEYGYWAHRTTPSTNATGDWTGLWHTRLHQSLIPVNEGSNAAALATEEQTAAGSSDAIIIPPVIKLAQPVPQIRPIWSPEYEAFKTATYIPPTLYPLTGQDRVDLVRLTEMHKAAVNAPMLMLTSLGGWMDFSGTWDEVSPDLKEWKHRATLGRDHYVRIVRGGYLFPFGHKAVKIDTTERKFAYAPSMPGVPTSKRKHAYLYKSTYIVVLEPTKTYSYTDHFRDRSFPLREITVVTKQTPKLDLPTALVDGLAAEKAFFPKVAGKRFLFETKAKDYAGNEITFQAPLAFVSQETDSEIDWIVRLSDEYAGASPAPAADMRGQAIAYTDTGPGSGSTTLATTRMQFDSIPMTSPSEWASADPRKPHFFPIMFSADVKSDAISQLTASDAGARMKYFQEYLDTGFRPGEVFFESDASIGVDYSASSAGGVASPRMQIKGLSRSRGPVCGDLATFNAGTFDPATYFPVSGASTASLHEGQGETTPAIPDAKLLGFLPLGEVLTSAGLDASPKVTVETNAGDLVTAFDWTYQWSGEKSLTLAIFETNGMDAPTTLHLRNEIRTPISSGGATKNITTGDIDNFALSFEPGGAKIMRVAFDKMSFRSATGEGTTLGPKVNAIEFGDALKFLDTVRQYIPVGSGSEGTMRAGLRRATADEDAGGPGVSVTADGIVVSESVMIPNIAIGVCAITNVNIGAKVTIPFSDSPAALAFNLSTIENPFGVSVCLIAGFGSFELELSTSGIEKLDASIQAGAMLSLNLGVASGTVSVAFGFHFRRDGDGFSFEAFFRFSGELSVLGLISVGITLMISLGFEAKPGGGDGGTLVGTATLAVKIKIAFFSKTVRISCRREIAGSDPLFTDMMSQTEWTDEYCAAFSPVPLGA